MTNETTHSSYDRELAPVELIETGSTHTGVEEGIALCLSGGGYRAMLFHVGTLWRLNELGILSKLTRISSVSGGSITAGVLGLNWSQLAFDSEGVGQGFNTAVTDPIRKLAGKTIDRGSILGGIFSTDSIGEKVTNAYRKYLFGEHTLQDLPDYPRFVINATNVQSGALWRFMKPYMRDYRVGEVKKPMVLLAQAIAASSAFPPFLSPVELELESSDFTPNSGDDLQRPPYTTDVVLSDGGVYDNLGLETAYKRYKTILVSDAGGKLKPEEEPKSDWAFHSYRVMELIDNQVRSLRKRMLIDSYISGARKGAYWAIRTNIADYGLSSALPCPHHNTLALADIDTRLKRLDGELQRQLINWGYAVCDAAVRTHVDTTFATPETFPYPESGVG
ncbi:MAG: patatin-like phospholipase family protein [Candidatus Thiodiazotropha sp.]|jgi:NTE family protein